MTWSFSGDLYLECVTRNKLNCKIISRIQASGVSCP